MKSTLINSHLPKPIFFQREKSLASFRSLLRKKNWYHTAAVTLIFLMVKVVVIWIKHLVFKELTEQKINLKKEKKASFETADPWISDMSNAIQSSKPSRKNKFLSSLPYQEGDGNPGQFMNCGLTSWKVYMFSAFAWWQLYCYFWKLACPKFKCVRVIQALNPVINLLERLLVMLG